MESDDRGETHTVETICLIGYRGTGKTSIAQQLAARLGWEWFDSDREVESETGRSIAEIFQDDGEAHFRNLECAAVAKVLAGRQRVVALGGGAVLRAENRQQMAASAKVVWLQASVETIASRLENDPLTASRRPNLTTDGGLQEIRQVLADRSPLYRECADLVVDTEDKDVVAVATEIHERLHLTSDGT